MSDTGGREPEDLWRRWRVPLRQPHERAGIGTGDEMKGIAVIDP